MHFKISEMKKAGIQVNMYDDVVELLPLEGDSRMFDAFNKLLRSSDLTRRNAELLADEFAGKAFNRYVFQVIDDG